MKKINVDTRKYIKAPIDGKNVVEESLLDAIFDDSQYLTNKFFFIGICRRRTYNDRVQRKLPIYQEATPVEYIRVG